jgi:outer membrane protein W
MKNQLKSGSSVAALLAAGGFALSAPGAQAQDMYDWKVFIAGAYVAPLSDTEIDGEDVSLSDEFGYELGVEWRAINRLGFELAYFTVDQDVEVDGDTFGEIGFNPLNLTLNIHVINRNAFNWYIGPTVSFVDWDDLEVPGSGSAEIESETAIGVSTGITVGLGETFALQFGVRYIDATAESGDASFDEEVSVDPLFASVGVAFRF